MVLFGFCETQQTVIPTLLYPCQINRRCKGCKFGDSLQESLKSRATFSLFFNCIMVAERKKKITWKSHFCQKILDLLFLQISLSLMKLKAAILHLLGLQKTLRLMKIKGAGQFKKAFPPIFSQFWLDCTARGTF